LEHHINCVARWVPVKRCSISCKEVDVEVLTTEFKTGWFACSSWLCG
jgi:hypothetical protein